MICPHCGKSIPDKRTIAQNSALHLWFSQVEAHCWERGLTLDDLYKEPNEVPITKEYLKGFFHRMEKIMYYKDSTTQLSKIEMGKVITACQKVFAERLDYSDPFPSIEVLEDEAKQLN